MADKLSPDEAVKRYDGMVRRLARAIANELNLVRELDELVAFGFEGLLVAHSRYDPALNDSFEAYAYRRINGAIYDGVGKVDRFSRRTLATCRRAGAAMQAMEDTAAVRREDGDDGHEDGDSLAAGIDEMLSRLAATAVAEVAAAEERRANPEVAFATKLEHKRLGRAIASLTDPRERDVIQWFYFEEWSLDQVAEKLRVSRSMASRIHVRALDKLRASL